MFKSLLKILIFLYLGILASANDCFTYLISETPVSYPCGSPGSFSSSSLNIKSPYKILTVSLSIKPTSLCLMNSDFNFLTVSILPASTNGVRKKIMMLTYLASSNKISVRTEDLTGIRSTVDIQLRTVPDAPINFVNNPANLYLSVDLGANKFTGGGVTSATNAGLTLTDVSYGSDWVLDSTLNIAVCSDYGGANSMGCTVSNLKVLYTFYEQNSILTFANQVKIIGDYKLDDDPSSVNVLTNSQGPLSSIAIPTATSPQRIPEGGLEFTSASQFIKLPAFIPSASDLTVTTSFAFTFYLKIDTAPTSNVNIFTYFCSQLQTNIFQLSLNPNMKLQTTVEGVNGDVNSALNLGEWYMVYSGHQYSYGGFGTAMVYVNGVQKAGYSYTRTAQGILRLSTLDTVTVGAGFIGKLRRLQVYSPAVYQMNRYMCDTSTCAVDLGFSTPATCLKTVCNTPGFYVSFGSCEKCPAGCLTCTDASTCQSCSPVGFYSDGTTCKSCSQHCHSCTDAQTCQACDIGYGFYNNYCVLCPAGTYLDNDGLCKELPQALQNALTGSQLTNSAATQAANLITKGNSVSLSAAVSGKIFSQIKYLNISYSGELQVALYTWLPSFVSLGLTPDIPESILEEIPKRQVPFVFQKYNVPSSFVVNFWENLGIMVFAVILWMLFKGFELLLKPNNSKLPRKARIIIQNFLITALFGIYGDLILFSIVEYRTLQFGWNLSLFSFLLSIILLIVMFTCFYFQIKLLLNYQRIKKRGQTKLLEKFAKDHEGSQILFKDFKDDSLAPQLFLFLLCGRDLVFSFLLATMFEYPVAQTTIVTLLDCLMIAYLFVKRPFQNSFDAAQQYFFELIALIVNVTVLFNAILDAGKYQTFQARKNIGKLIIVANMIFNFVTAVFMLISVAKALIEFYKEQKQKRTKRVVTLKTVNQLQRLPLHTNSSKAQNKQNSMLQDSIVIENSLETSNQEHSFQNLLPTLQKRYIKRYKTRRPQNLLHKPGQDAKLE